MTAVPGRLLTKAEAATQLRCSPQTVRRRVAAGQLAAIRDGANRLLFRPEFIEAYLAEHTVPAAAPQAKPKRHPKYLQQ